MTNVVVPPDSIGVSGVATNRLAKVGLHILL